jgi:DNA-binding HxlR family transcriptional regulator
MLTVKMSLQILQALVEEKNVRELVSSATLTKCFKDLAKHKLIVKQKKKYVPTEKGILLINLIESEIEEQKEQKEEEEDE